jgi:transcriptional regulator with XRE-family HTH domain
MHNIGLTTDHSDELPLTQEEIADALGLTPVHVNRVLQRMRREGLISLTGGALTIHVTAGWKRRRGSTPITCISRRGRSAELRQRRHPRARTSTTFTRRASRS